MEYSTTQKTAIGQHEGQIILISCPGSGKTSTVVARVADMVKNGINPSEILAVTFTKAAANEMKARYLKEVNEIQGADAAVFCTIHSFCYNILTQQHGYTNENIVTDNEAWDCVSKIVQKLRKSGMLGMEIRDYTEFIRSCITEISKVANNPYHEWGSYEPETLKSKEAFQTLYEQYQGEKRAANKVDFDDMLSLVNSVFDTQPSILLAYQMRFKYLIIDEFQDTNFLQRDLLYKLAGDNPNICVVGDDDQSIYRFRGAKPEIMLSFKKSFPNCRELYMDVNYRSRAEIVAAARNVISYNKTRFVKDIKPGRDSGGKVKCLKYDSKAEEYDAVMNRIKLIQKEGVPYEKMAILFRNNSLAQGWASACMAAGIPFHSTEKIQDKYQGWIFRDIMAYWRMANGTGTVHDLMAIANKPQRYLPVSVFKSTRKEDIKAEILRAKFDEEWKRGSALSKVDNLFAQLRSLEGQSPSDFLLILRKIVGYDAYLTKYAEFRRMDIDDLKDEINFFSKEAEEYDTFAEWQTRIRQYGEQIRALNAKRDKHGILLSTMHKAKGLEWDIVFVVHANEEIIPHSKMKTPEEIEEERRLFYVAITRAKEQLYVSSFGINPSRFVKEMEKENAKSVPTGEDPEEYAKKKRRSAIRRKDAVRHNVHGSGVVLDMQGSEILVKYRNGAKILRHSLKDLDSGVLKLI